MPESADRSMCGRMLDKSSAKPGQDHVDLYIYHMWDYRTPLYEIMEGLNNAVKAGKARYIGISNCFAWQLCKANELARREGFAPFISVQGHYNLIFREEEREMIPYCREEGIAVTPYSALAGGRLSKLPGRPPGVWRRMPTPRASMMPPRRRMPASLSAWRSWPGSMRQHDGRLRWPG